MIVLKNTPINQIFYILRNSKNGSGCWDLTHSNVEYNSNGTFTIAPPEGYDGLSSVTVKVDVKCSGITTSESEINSSNDGGDYTIGISSGYSWTATASEDWITVTPSSGEDGVAVVVITVSENEGDERTGTVTIVNDNGDVNVIDITQEGSGTDYSKMNLTIEAKTAGTLLFTAANSGNTKTIEYSLDNGQSWYEITSTVNGATIATMQVGDKVQLRGNNTSYGGSGSILERNSLTYTGNFDVYGNIMSLVGGSDTLDDDFTFSGLFYDATGLQSAENLVLPATTLTVGCYKTLFYNCYQMNSAPLLPATNLANSCYEQMFYNCGITTAPELPAETLVYGCYRAMFQLCRNLTSTELPANTFVQSCYEMMFNGCTSLIHIKCLANSISAADSTRLWVDRVSPTGTFVCPDPSVWTTGTDGIPSGWTVETI